MTTGWMTRQSGLASQPHPVRLGHAPTTSSRLVDRIRSAGHLYASCDPGDWHHTRVPRESGWLGAHRQCGLLRIVGLDADLIDTALIPAIDITLTLVMCEYARRNWFPTSL